MQHFKRILVVSTSLEKKLLEKSIIKNISALTKSEGNILWENVAAEFVLDQSFNKINLDAIKLYFKNLEIDFNLIKSNSKNSRKKKLLVADMDSTIVSSETLDDLGSLTGKLNEIKKITDDAMEGKIDFVKSLVKRVKTLKKTHISLLDSIKYNLKYNNGARELISTMRKNGGICALCTGGFYYIANEVKKTLNFDHLQANTLEIINNYITGNLISPIYNGNSKAKFLEELAKKYKISLENTCAIGDGANDIEMIKKASLGVCFKGKKKLKESSNFILQHSDLTGLLFLQGYSKSEIQQSFTNINSNKSFF